MLPVGTVTGTGRRRLAEHAKANRVIAVMLGAPTIEQPGRIGDAKYTDKGRQVLQRQFDIEWYIHGVRSVDDTDAKVAEDLYLAVLYAVRQEAHHGVAFSGERWLDQEDGADGLERYGSVIMFTSAICLPVYEPRGGLKQLTANPKIDTTFTLNGQQEG